MRFTPAANATRALLRAGCGYWDITDYPEGGCFRRATADLSCTLIGQHPAKKGAMIARLDTGERITTEAEFFATR